MSSMLRTMRRKIKRDRTQRYVRVVSKKKAKGKK